jgi:hypothetical protein
MFIYGDYNESERPLWSIKQRQDKRTSVCPPVRYMSKWAGYAWGEVESGTWPMRWNSAMNWSARFCNIETRILMFASITFIFSLLPTIAYTALLIRCNGENLFEENHVNKEGGRWYHTSRSSRPKQKCEQWNALGEVILGSTRDHFLTTRKVDHWETVRIFAEDVPSDLPFCTYSDL